MSDQPEDQRLPRGRHQLSRDEVAEAQRRRVFRALGQVLSEHGYAGTSVGAVLRCARISRETFYELFTGKEDCFLAAVDEAVDRVLGEAVQAAGGADPLERWDRGLRAYLEAIVAHPESARLVLIETYAAGPAALERRTALQQRFAEAVGGLFGRRRASDRFAAEALVAATSGLVTARVAAGDLDGVRKLHRPLVDLATRLRRRDT